MGRCREDFHQKDNQQGRRIFMVYSMDTEAFWCHVALKSQCMHQPTS